MHQVKNQMYHMLNINRHPLTMLSCNRRWKDGTVRKMVATAASMCAAKASTDLSQAFVYPYQLQAMLNDGVLFAYFTYPKMVLLVLTISIPSIHVSTHLLHYSVLCMFSTLLVLIAFFVLYPLAKLSHYFLLFVGYWAQL